MGDFGKRVKPGELLTIDEALINANPFQVVPATPNRISYELQNKSITTVYWGIDNTVAVGTHPALAPATAGNDGDGGVVQIDLEEGEAIWVRAVALPARLCVTELIGV